MFELAQGLGFDLADTFAGDRELLANLFQRVVGIHADAETHTQDTFLTRGQGRQHAGRGLAQIGLDGRIDRQDSVLVLDEITEMAVFLVTDRRFQRDRLLGDLHHLAHLLERHGELFGQFFRRRLTTDLVQHLTAGADDLVDRLDHVHRNTDGACLVRDGAGNGLADPPGGIGREFVTAAIFEFVDGLHQADIALLDEIQELQAAIGVFLGDGDDETQIGLDHFLLGHASLALALLDRANDTAQILDRHTGTLGQFGDVITDDIGIGQLTIDETIPGLGGALHGLRPVRAQLVPEIAVHELGAWHAMGVRHTQQLAFQRHAFLVDRIELFNQGLDTRIVEVHRIEIGDNGGLGVLILLAALLGQVLAFDTRGNELVLQLPESSEVSGDAVEGFHDAIAQLRFHRGKRQGCTVVIIVVIVRAFALFTLTALTVFGLRLFFLVLVVTLGGRLGSRRGTRDRCLALSGLTALALFTFLNSVLAAIGGIQIDDIAQQDLAFLQLITPDHDGLKGQRAFAEAADHRIATGLDAFGDSNLAFTRQEFDRTHLAQIHAHRIIGAVRRRAGILTGDNGLGTTGRGDSLAVTALGIIVAIVFFGVFILVDHIDAHFGQLSENILDLLGGKLLRRQNIVQLFMRDIAALFRSFDEVLDCLVRQIEERTILWFRCVVGFGRLCHLNRPWSHGISCAI